MSNKDSSSNNQVERMPNSGQWKDGVCDCFNHGFFHPMVWNACCFSLSKCINFKVDSDV